jgi:ATP-dependent exoDNAse (exonuclease V) beta subunit
MSEALPNTAPAEAPINAEPPARQPTPEQAAAIGAASGDVLLEAGAGTGKTGVMVDRYCRLVCEKRVSPDAILAFTFTDKAAAELRARIRAELARRADAGEDRARELLASFGGAWVTTIHGFCNRLLAAHPVAAGIDPGFRVLDAPEAARAARDAFDEALAEFLADADPRREETVAAFEIEGLRAIVAGAHDELRGRGVAEPQLPEPLPPDLDGALRRLAEAADAVLAEADPEDPKCDPVRRAAERLAEPGPPPQLDQLRAFRTESRAKPLAAYREAVEAAVSRSAEIGEGGEAYGHVATLLQLYSGRFGAAKERRGGIDFEDLQILAARLLERAEIGEAYRSRFRHLLVDEFQDTNRLQLRLVEALHGPGSQLVVVGDELQSIYGFRHADLDVFRAQRDEAERRADAELMELSGNFRSRPEVIGAVNLFGEALLGARYRPLRAGAPAPEDPPPGPGPAVELLLTARDGWDSGGIELEPAIDASTPLNCLAEARAVAERLRELTAAGVERGAMVVLLRAYTHLDAYEDSLERAGLRPYVVGGRGYWSQQQVADVTALLRTVANPLDDEALFGALASPAVGAAPDTLWLLRMAAGRKRHVWPALERAVGLGESELAEPERLEAIGEEELALLATFAARLTGLRERAPRLALSALIEEAISLTGYDLAVLMRPAGEARFANVRKLTRLADEFEEREGRDLRGFLDFLAARAESDAEAQAATAAEGHDGVRIMTVHNAKGLEFDVVAVPDLSRSLLAGARPPLLLLRREQPPRVGMQLRRLGTASINLYEYAELLEESRARDSEEGLRLFHVAATRARQRLILSGVVKPEPGREVKASTPVIERLVDSLGLARDADDDLDDRRPRQPALPRARRRAAGAPPRRRRRARARRRAAAADRAPSTRRPQPPPLLHRHIGLRRMPLPLLPRARARHLRRDRSPLVRHTRSNGERSARRGAGGDAFGAGRADGARRRRARAARVEPGERVAGAVGGAGAAACGGGRARRRAPRPDGAARPDPRLARLPPSRRADRRRVPRPGRGADPPRGRRHRPPRIHRPAGRARRRPAPGRRLQDRSPRRIDPGGARPPLRHPALDLRPGRRRGPRRRARRGRLRLPRAPRRTGPHHARPRRTCRRPRRPRARHRPHPRPRVPGGPTRPPRLVPLQRLPGPWQPLLRPGRRLTVRFFYLE